MKKYWIIFITLLLANCQTPKKEIFLIGDSISIEYTPYLKEDIKDFANLERKEDDGTALKNLDVPMGANGGDSQMVLDYLQHKIQDPEFVPDYVILNCGLHDIKRNPQSNAIQINENLYSKNLAQIFKLLKDKDIQPIWIRTTWVVDSIHNEKSKAFYRYHADAKRYNEIADSICSSNGIPIIDLYTFSKNQGIESIRDHIHYLPKAQKEQADFIAEELMKYIK